MIAYFDCFSGISGDMTLGACVDLGVPVDWLKQVLSTLPLSGFDIKASNVQQNNISATRIEVVTDENKHSRNYEAIRSLINAGPLSDKTKNISLDIFEKIARAEARIHGCPKDKVHFHETGGIDAIVDIVGTALCMEYLGITKVTASRLPLGNGFVQCKHGTLPVPAPAAVEILKNVPVYGADVLRELVTPTGAAIITTLAESFGPMPDMIMGKTGYGAGNHKSDAIPNLLRIITGTMPDDRPDCMKDEIVIIETCIDDMNQEFFGFLMERLFEDGALDVYWIPVFMKKNRPGTMVQVICREMDRETLVRRILSETTSLGVRYYHARRTMLERCQVEVKTSFGTIQAKQITDIKGYKRIVPEYEVCRRIAIEKKLPIREVYDTIVRDIASV